MVAWKLGQCRCKVQQDSAEPQASHPETHPDHSASINGSITPTNVGLVLMLVSAGFDNFKTLPTFTI